MKLILSILFSLIFLSAFSQQGNFEYLQVYRRFNLANRNVKGISNDTAWLIGSADSLVTQYAVKGYLYSKYGPGTNNLYGEIHQLLGAKFDNSNQLEFLEPLVEGNFITTDEELDEAVTHFVDPQTIFSTWKRFSHGSNRGGVGNPTPSDTIPGTPLETNSWAYNAGTNTISSTLNSSSYIGFVSPQKYSSYTHSLTFSASGGDNDYVTTVIGYVEDANDKVPNNAFGLNPANFSWPINTTDRLIPNQHTISLVRGRTNQPNFPFPTPVRYAIVYDMGKLGQQILVNGDSLVWNTTNNYGSGAACDVKVIRSGDIIKTYTTDWTDAPGGEGALGHELVYDLSTLPVTNKFRGSAAYGYGALSQENSSFTNLSVSPSINTIYDLRNGEVWVADPAGNYSIDTSRNYFDEYGVRRFLHNIYTNKSLYVNPDRSFITIGGGIGDTLKPTDEFDPIFSSSPAASLGQQNIQDIINLNDTALHPPAYLIRSWINAITKDTLYLNDSDFYNTGHFADPIRVKRYDNHYIDSLFALSGGTGTGGTPVTLPSGQIGFGGTGGKVVGSSNLFYDTATNKMRIGAASLTTKLNITSSDNSEEGVRAINTSAGANAAAALLVANNAGTGGGIEVLSTNYNVVSQRNRTILGSTRGVSILSNSNSATIGEDNIQLVAGSSGLTPQLTIYPNGTIGLSPITKAQRNAIISPTQGTVVFVSDNGGYLSYYNNGSWMKITANFD